VSYEGSCKLTGKSSDDVSLAVDEAELIDLLELPGTSMVNFD
jgi:hypothetical protein